MSGICQPLAAGFSDWFLSWRPWTGGSLCNWWMRLLTVWDSEEQRSLDDFGSSSTRHTYVCVYLYIYIIYYIYKYALIFKVKIWLKDFWTEFSAGRRPVAAEKPLGAATIMASGTAGDCMGVLFRWWRKRGRPGCCEWWSMVYQSPAPQHFLKQERGGFFDVPCSIVSRSVRPEQGREQMCRRRWLLLQRICNSGDKLTGWRVTRKAAPFL